MLGGPEFQRRVRARVDEMITEEQTNLALAKDWADFSERRGRLRAFIKVSAEIHEIIRLMESI